MSKGIIIIFVSITKRSGYTLLSIPDLSVNLTETVDEEPYLWQVTSKLPKEVPSAVVPVHPNERFMEYLTWLQEYFANPSDFSIGLSSPSTIDPEYI